MLYGVRSRCDQDGMKSFAFSTPSRPLFFVRLEHIATRSVEVFSQEFSRRPKQGSVVLNGIRTRCNQEWNRSHCSLPVFPWWCGVRLPLSTSSLRHVSVLNGMRLRRDVKAWVGSPRILSAHPFDMSYLSALERAASK